MAIKITVNNVNPNKLHDELINANLIPLLVTHDRVEGEIIAQNTWIEFNDDVDMIAVQIIIDSHDPVPKPQAPTEDERLNLLEQAMNDLLLGGV